MPPRYAILYNTTPMAPAHIANQIMKNSLPTPLGPQKTTGWGCSVMVPRISQWVSSIINDRPSADQEVIIADCC